MKALRGALSALAAGLMLTFVAQPGVAQDEEPIDVTYVIVCCPGDLFWEPLIFGADLAAKHYNVNLDYQQGENDPVRINNIVETAIANDVDGIVWGITVEGAYTDVIQKARGRRYCRHHLQRRRAPGSQGHGATGVRRPGFCLGGLPNRKYMVEQHNLGEGISA